MSAKPYTCDCFSQLLNLENGETKSTSRIKQMADYLTRKTAGHRNELILHRCINLAKGSFLDDIAMDGEPNMRRHRCLEFDQARRLAREIIGGQTEFTQRIQTSPAAHPAPPTPPATLPTPPVAHPDPPTPPATLPALEITLYGEPEEEPINSEILE